MVFLAVAGLENTRVKSSNYMKYIQIKLLARIVYQITHKELAMNVIEQEFGVSPGTVNQVAAV